MPQSLAKILVHIVFSTKQRKRLIAPDIREELHAYLVGVLRNLDSPALLVNSVDDHVHILCRLSRNHAVKTIVEEVKKSSSKWIKTKGEAFRGFYWQSGFPVAPLQGLPCGERPEVPGRCPGLVNCSPSG
jgi:putative transposase